MCVGKRGSGPEGADDLCFVSFEALGLNLSINNLILAFRLRSEHQCCDLNHEFMI